MITQKILQESHDYDPETGLFTVRKSGRVCTWRNHDGYAVIYVKGQPYRGGRMAWLYTNGTLPKHTIDHVNRVRHDDRISNLRDVTMKEQMANRKQRTRWELRCDNTSKTIGVSYEKLAGKWSAYIKKDGVQRRLGSYHNKANAIKARRKAELALDINGAFN